MAIWLKCKEKIHQHNYLVRCRLEGSLIMAAPHKWLPPGLKLDRKLHIASAPLVSKISLDALETEYGASHFHAALRRYILLSSSPHLTTMRVERGL